MTELSIGFTESERARVGELYWAAFGPKLRIAFRDEATGVAQVTAALRPDRALIARVDGQVAGMCGFHHDGHGAVDLSWAGLRAGLGIVAAAWAALTLAPLDRRERDGVLVLDGICVAAEHRGRGIGSALLDAVTELAARHGDQWVQLSVIDTNPRAEALYRRHGFATAEHGSLGPLRHLYGFDRYRTMRKRTW
ncbi:putative GCN5-related N-acetyltransferase [Actinoplanes missouriensis 431]|uniref:Putative GCN5-related N-acetyltransferase n=1 Tax=Actinoplanes missouriensis (strain ATCC 14538 / DSM 43046 / CBS 188.64 / JCM 3121 / NBRC 102363 / NCIMB 12654 / NRRL B-3342 / UNCC 431) TaxID=512565 RepID=I0H5L4_ACTM4|nr:GNAT family N-acetyltransferase [Actinoplanes missouriensis]BAL88301.1 putative GCN5-related N-acetyltransferase [Actinoplanes missouriensis 431]